MPLSDSVVKSFKKIQQKPVKERKKIQVFVIIVFLTFLLILGVISLKWEFSKSESSFSVIGETEESKKLGILFRKMGGLGGRIKEEFRKIKEDEEIRKIFENYGR